MRVRDDGRRSPEAWVELADPRVVESDDLLQALQAVRDTVKQIDSEGRAASEPIRRALVDAIRAWRQLAETLGMIVHGPDPVDYSSEEEYVSDFNAWAAAQGFEPIERMEEDA